jgi:hypothetical protein
MQLATDYVRLGFGLAAKNVDLHFYRDQGLHRSIVQFAGEAGALRSASASSKAMEQIDIVDGGSHLAE